MAQFVVRDLEQDIKVRLRRRAQRHGRSLEEEVREILRDALKEEALPKKRISEQLHELFGEIGLERHEKLEELPREEVRPVRFKR